MNEHALRIAEALERIAALHEQKNCTADKLPLTTEENDAEGLKDGDIAKAGYEAPAGWWNAIVRVERVLPNGEILVRSDGKYAVVQANHLEKINF